MLGAESGQRRIAVVVSRRLNRAVMAIGAAVLLAVTACEASIAPRQQPAETSSGSQVLGDLSERVLRGFAEVNTVVSIKVASDSLDEFQQSAQREAVKAASGFITFTDGHDSAAASLCVVTIHGYGTVTGDKDSAGNAEGEVKLAVDHRTLWVVEFDDIDMPVFGPVKSEGQASYEESDVVIFVDPETMKPFRAETLP
jgi:hypothetical protein